MTWNVRGLGRVEKRRSVRLALERVRPEVILMQETKLSDAQGDVFRGWLHAGMDVCCLPGVHATGGIATFWRKDTFKCNEVIQGDNFVLVSLTVLSSQEEIWLGNVYGPHEVATRVAFFRALGVELEIVEGKVVIGGDFNAILNDGERQGTNVDVVGEYAFKEFVSSTF